MSEVDINPAPELVPSGNSGSERVAVTDSAGARLMHARQQMGLSIEQVAEQLKLSFRQISAIESDEFDKLPKMVIVRGFVRSYAKLLKIDAAPLLACLPADNSGLTLDADLRPTLATPFLESRSPFLGRAENNKKYLLGAVFLAVAALLFIAAQHFERSEAFKSLFTSSESEKSTSDQVAASLPQIATSASNNAAGDAFPPDAAPTVGNNEKGSAISDSLANQPIVSNLNETKSAHAEVAAVSVPTVATVVNPSSAVALNEAKQGSNQLHLKFRQDSWLQIKKESGEIVTSHMAKAGTEEFFDVKDALQLRLGNAHGVDAWVRGAVLDIVPPKDTNVINLTVK